MTLSDFAGSVLGQGGVVDTGLGYFERYQDATRDAANVREPTTATTAPPDPTANADGKQVLDPRETPTNTSNNQTLIYLGVGIGVLVGGALLFKAMS